jgi:hypothetical protein
VLDDENDREEPEYDADSVFAGLSSLKNDDEDDKS